MATLTYIGPPSPGWADNAHTDPDDPDARWVDDLGTAVDLPGGRRQHVLVGEVIEAQDEWLDPDHPDGRLWPDTRWRISGGPTDGRRVGELRAALARRGLSTDGKRDELLDRLHAAERADPEGVAASKVRNLGSPDNPGDFPDAPGADEALTDGLRATSAGRQWPAEQTDDERGAE